MGDRDSGVGRPVTWIGTFPVYASTLVAALHAVSMLLTALALAGGATLVLNAFRFSSEAVLESLTLWQFVTYAFVHEPPYLFFLLELYFLVIFGREIERFLGRRAFLQIYVTLLLLPPVALTMLGLLGFPTVFAGSGALHFRVLVAFAALYPRAEILFSLQARWVVGAFFAVNAIQCIAVRDFLSLGVLVLECAAAWLMVAQMKFGPLVRWPERKRPPEPVVVAPRRRQYEGKGRVTDSIDPILDKISRTGIASLTADERRLLEKARAELLAGEKTL